MFRAPDSTAKISELRAPQEKIIRAPSIELIGLRAPQQKFWGSRAPGTPLWDPVQWQVYHKQAGGVAVGSRLRPYYACLFMGHIEEQIFTQYMGPAPALYKRYIDDIAGATSGTREEIEDFANFVNGFHSNVNFTWSISEEQLPSLDLCLKPTFDGLVTSIHSKETDT